MSQQKEKWQRDRQYLPLPTKKAAWDRYIADGGYDQIQSICRDLLTHSKAGRERRQMIDIINDLWHSSELMSELTRPSAILDLIKRQIAGSKLPVWSTQLESDKVHLADRLLLSVKDISEREEIFLPMLETERRAWEGSSGQSIPEQDLEALQLKIKLSIRKYYLHDLAIHAWGMTQFDTRSG